MNKIFNTTKCLSIDDIRQYLAGEIDEQNQFRIENHLLDCPLCSDAVEGYANHYNFDEDNELAEIQSRQSRGRVAMAKTASIRRLPHFNRIAAAAMVVILAGAGLMYWQNQQPERLYQAYHEPFVDETFAASRSAAEGAQSAELREAVNLQEAGNYAASLPLLIGFLENKPEHPMANMLLGIAYLEDGKTEEAKEVLGSVRINHELYYEEASWYLALAYLRDDMRAEARQLLQELGSNESGYYYEQAKELLEDL